MSKITALTITSILLGATGALSTVPVYSQCGGKGYTSPVKRSTTTSSTGASTGTLVTVSGSASHSIPSTMWGLMFEDISYSGDGGLYGELLMNRAFQQVTPGTSAALTPWAAVGTGNISVIADSPAISTALPNALNVSLSAPNSGVSNSGYWGIKVSKATTYTGSFYYRFPSAPGSTVTATVGLKSSSGSSLVTTRVLLKSTTSWTKTSFTMSSLVDASDTSNVFVVTFGSFTGTVYLGMFSLFPPTFKNQANGMRQDIAQALYDLKPSFFRFPGGNNIEGQTAAQRWQFNQTLGDLTARPGRVGDGLGFYEYLVWIESMGMQPIMAVWAGYSLDGLSIADGSMDQYIEQARQQDFFSSTSYVYRWKDIVTALQADYPSITTAYDFDPQLTPTPKSYDNHVYASPDWFMANSNFYDGYTRNGTIYFEGEYAAISTNDADVWDSYGRLTYPTVWSAVSEAAFMMGLERNSDIVFAASYAPLIGRAAENQWTPNLLAYDPSTVYKSTSYYVQQLFSTYRGDQYLPSTLAPVSGSLFWGIVKNSKANEVKVANGGTTAESLTFALPTAVAPRGSLIQLSGANTTSNTPTNPNAVVPITSSISTRQNLTFTAPAFSFSVILVPI
ncbi:glycoside hydrolase [Clavulina sp. PMI_390]|nr:glycoside hydrolase [Clavulina sp. PMI_390]